MAPGEVRLRDIPVVSYADMASIGKGILAFEAL